MAAQTATYSTVLARLRTYPPPLLPPGHPYNKSTTSDIAALQLHPSLEASLHLLNHDLPSAHFLVRKMEAPPAVQGMTVHAILHRIEGDYDNARAWYKDIANDDQGLKFLEMGVGGLDGALGFVDQVEAFKKKKQGDGQKLGRRSLDEIMVVVKQCEEMFGTYAWTDATSAFTKSPEKNQKMKESMVVGGQGYRKF